MNKTRLEFIDVAKFIGMILVILTHCQEGGGHIIPTVYSFHLPLFFILNGWTLKIDNLSFGEYLVKKIKSYLIPIFCLGSIVIIFQLFFYHKEGGLIYFGNEFLNLVEQRRALTLWFIGALFFSDIFFYAVYKLGKNKIVFMSIISLLFLGLGIFINYHYHRALFWNLDAMPFGVFFVYIGYLCSHEKLKKMQNYILSKRWLSLLVGAGLFFIGFLFSEINYHVFNQHLEMWGNQYKEYYLTIPSAVFLSLGVIYLCNTISNKVLGELGKTTFVLLAFHQTMAMPIFQQKMFPSWYATFKALDKMNLTRYQFSSAETLFCLVFCIAIYYIICYTPLAFMIRKRMPDFYKKAFYQAKQKISAFFHNKEKI
ncbi:MAG: acyltransferase [Erysipelotrichales bacterium]|nr:acyltransferase [Erysipelotrichales bacterium]